MLVKKFKSVKRISILGGQGTGKTILANNIGKELNLPIYHLDSIQNMENWKKRDKRERDEIILNKVKESSWIIDGTYVTTLEERVKKSDLIIFLNFSTIERVKGVMLRYLKNRGKEKKEIPGCKENFTLKFLKYTIDWDKEKEEVVNEILERNSDRQIIVFKKRKELNKWYINNFGKKIDLKY